MQLCSIFQFCVKNKFIQFISLLVLRKKRITANCWPGSSKYQLSIWRIIKYWNMNFNLFWCRHSLAFSQHSMFSCFHEIQTNDLYFFSATYSYINSSRLIWGKVRSICNNWIYSSFFSVAPWNVNLVTYTFVAICPINMHYKITFYFFNCQEEI